MQTLEARIKGEVIHSFSPSANVLSIYGKCGNGKTNFLDEILLDMLERYSAEEFELYIVDFKGTEFEPLKSINGVHIIQGEDIKEFITGGMEKTVDANKIQLYVIDEFGSTATDIKPCLFTDMTTGHYFIMSSQYIPYSAPNIRTVLLERRHIGFTALINNKDLIATPYIPTPVYDERVAAIKRKRGEAVG